MIIVAILGFFQFERYQKFIVQTDASLSNLNTRVDQGLQATDKTIAMLQQQVQALQANQNQQTQAVQAEAQSVSRETALNLGEDFNIFEAYHLTLLAQQNLTMGNDVANAIELLSAADHALQNVQNPGYKAVRQVLETDLKTLQSVPLPDKQTIWLTVGTLMDNIDKLHTRGIRNIRDIGTMGTESGVNSGPLRTDTETEKTDNMKNKNSANINAAMVNENANTKANGNKNANAHSKDNETANTNTNLNTNTNTNTNTSHTTADNTQSSNISSEPSGIKQALANTWEQFKDLIKIQRHTKPVEPILSQEEQLFAAEHLRLNLEQIRWAILHNNPMLYQTSIQETIVLLHNYFEPSDPQVNRFESTLLSLAKINIKPELPDLQPLVRLFQEQGAQ